MDGNVKAREDAFACEARRRRERHGAAGSASAAEFYRNGRSV